MAVPVGNYELLLRCHSPLAAALLPGAARLLDREMGDTERLIDALLGLPAERLLDFAAQFKPSSVARLQATAQAAANDASAMESLLQMSDTDVDCADDRMWTPLMTAASAGNDRVMGVLLRKGARWELQNEDGEAPLHLALKNCHRHCAKTLLEHGCDPNVRTSSGATPLIVAAGAGQDMPSMRMMLDTPGSNVECTDQNGCTALIYAARGGHLSATQLLLERGASPNAVDKRGATALHHAAEMGALEVVALLLRAGASLEGEAAGQTPRGVAAAACAEGGSLRHLAVVELLESYANGEDLTGEILQTAGEPDESLPEPGSVMSVLNEVGWSKAGVAMQAHEDEGARKPRPFSKVNMGGASRRKGSELNRSKANNANSFSNYGVKVPLKMLDRLYVRQRRQENRRASLTSAGHELLAQPPCASQPESSLLAQRQSRPAWSPDVVERLTCIGQPGNTPDPPSLDTDVADVSTCTEAVRLAFKHVGDEGTPPDLKMNAIVAAVAAVTRMKRGNLPAEMLPPKCMTALLSRAIEQMVGALRAAANGDDVEAMARALRDSRSCHRRLVDALGGAQLPRELLQRAEASTYECESRKAAVTSAARRMNAAWRSGDPAEISASITAAISLSLPQSGSAALAEGDNGTQSRLQGLLGTKAKELQAKLPRLVAAQRLLSESCKQLDSAVPVDAATLERNEKLISECAQLEAIARTADFRRLQSVVAEEYAMAEEVADKENICAETDKSDNRRGRRGDGASAALTTTETQARLKMESKALLAQRRVEIRSADAASRRATTRRERVQQVEAQLAQNRSTTQQRQQDLRASIASKEDRTLQHQLALSEERAQRLAKYTARESNATAAKNDLEAAATAKLLVARAESEQRDMLRSIEADERGRDGAERRRIAQQRRDDVAQRGESLEAQRQSTLAAKLSEPGSSTTDAATGTLAPAKATAAFLSTTRTQRESVLVSYSGGTSRNNNPKFYVNPTSAGAAADPDAVWRETAFPYPEPEVHAPIRQRRQVVGRWIRKT